MGKARGTSRFNKLKQRQSNKNRGSESIRDPTTKTSRTSYKPGGLSCCGLGTRVTEPVNNHHRIIEESTRNEESLEHSSEQTLGMRYDNSPALPNDNLFTMESYGPEDDKQSKKKRKNGGDHRNKK